MHTPKAYSAKSVIFLEAPAFERIRWTTTSKGCKQKESDGET